MAAAKSRAASRKSAPSRSRSAARTSSPAQTSTSAGDNADGANLVNEKANADAEAAREAAIEAQDAAEAEARKDLDPKVAALIFDTSEPQTSLNSLPKDEGGLPADVISGLRATVDQHKGAAALGQPGQSGHGVGTGTPGLAGTLSDEENEANEKEYARRTSGS